MSSTDSSASKSSEEAKVTSVPTLATRDASSVATLASSKASSATTLATVGNPPSAIQLACDRVQARPATPGGILSYACSVRVFDGEKTFKSVFSGNHLPISSQTFTLDFKDKARSRSPPRRPFDGTPFQDCSLEQLRCWKLTFGDGTVRTSVGWREDHPDEMP